MKHIFSLLLSLALSITAGFAQNRALRIESFTHDPFDQAAKDYPMRDGSGDLRALIKVRPANKDLKFDFGYMSSVVDTKEHEGELWIYVQKNARNISIKGKGYDPILNEDLGITLSGGATYVLKLQYDKLQTKFQYISFNVQPPNAVVEMNGQTLNAVDGPVSLYLPYGTYEYHITAPRYLPTTGTVTLNNSKEKHTETVNLEPTFTNVTLRADEETEIWINNVKKSIGSWSDELDYGTYTIECKKNKYYSTKQEITISKDNPQPTITLQAPTPSFTQVTLQTNEGVEIWINNVKKSTGTWTGELNYGTYLVECRLANHRASKQEITITKTNPQPTITLQAPTPIYGSLDINSIPAGANINIDGKDIGTTPLFKQEFIIGPHKVCISKNGYSDYVTKIVVSEKTTDTIVAQLKNVFPVIIQCDHRDARISVDGKDMGSVTDVKSLLLGYHKITITKDGYYTYETNIHVTENGTNQIKATLDKKYTNANGEELGIVNLSCNVKSANVVVDGKYVGKVSKLTLPIGTHTVTIQKKGYDDRSKQIDVKKREKTNEYFHLTKIEPSAQNKIIPSSATAAIAATTTVTPKQNATTNNKPAKSKSTYKELVTNYYERFGESSSKTSIGISVGTSLSFNVGLYDIRYKWFELKLFNIGIEKIWNTNMMSNDIQNFYNLYFYNKNKFIISYSPEIVFNIPISRKCCFYLGAGPSCYFAFNENDSIRTRWSFNAETGIEWNFKYGAIATFVRYQNGITGGAYFKIKWGRKKQYEN